MRQSVRQRGAALLLLLIGLGLGVAALMMTAFRPGQLQQQRALQTGLALQQAREALLGFAAAHGRLPRPAKSATNGQERAEPCDSARACTGFLPWVTLSVDGADSWGKRLRYSVTPEFTVAPIHATSAVGDKAVLGRNSLGQTYYLVGESGCAISVQCAPAVIFSNGKNNLGTSVDGVPQANAALTNGDEQQNDVATNVFISREPTLNPAAPGGEFDNYLVWLPLQRLYRRMSAAGMLQ